MSDFCAHPVLVYNVGNNVQLAIVLAIVDDDDPSHLNIPLERHFEGLIPLPSDPKCSKGLRRRTHKRLALPLTIFSFLKSVHGSRCTVHGQRMGFLLENPLKVDVRQRWQIMLSGS